MVIYRSITILLVLVSGQIAAALTPAATNPGPPYFGDNCILHLNNQNSRSADSLLALATIDFDFISPRYSQLKYKSVSGDTIRKSSDRNIDLLNKNGLTTLKSKGENNFLTRNFFSLIVKDNQQARGQMGVNSTRYFAPFAGMEIGKIRILQLDVFGPTLLDTSRIGSGWFEKTGNRLHVKTMEQKLRDQLLFNSGECLNPQLMAENEKFIRDLPYIQDVAITITTPGVEAGTVDIVIIIKERFEYGVSGNVSLNSTDWELSDQNMFGLGHQLSILMNYNPSELNKWGGGFKYQISDIDRKFMNIGIGYNDDFRKKGWNSYIEKRYIASKIGRAHV